MARQRLFGVSSHLFHDARLGREHLLEVGAAGFDAVELFATRTHVDYHNPVAVADLQQWLATDPFDPVGHLEKGNTLLQLGDLEGAMRAYECSAIYGPSSFVAQVSLAGVYQRLGFARKAAETWRKARPLAPDEVTRARIDAHLGSPGERPH